jgi:two-component system cell cycle response regulator CpdR
MEAGYQHALSVIATDLPSKKRRVVTARNDKTRAFIDSTAVPAHNRVARFTAASTLHPKFTTHRANWADCSTHPDSTPPAMHKILLAEDDNDMRRFLVKALENAGFQVSPHDNGLSAYQRLREEPFEMLLTDIVMPEMDGIELARRAAELDPDIKIMFITGFAAVALNSDSDAPKNAKVLSKPVHLRELVSEVNKMLAA